MKTKLYFDTLKHIGASIQQYLKEIMVELWKFLLTEWRVYIAIIIILTAILPALVVLARDLRGHTRTTNRRL